MKNKILKITGIALILIIAITWSAPYLLKGRITRLVKSRMNRELKAHVNFSDLDISWFRHFPNMAIGLNNLEITCVGEFDGDTLLSAKQLDAALGIGSLIAGDSFRIYSLIATEPRIHALVHKNGHSNWDIRKENAVTPDIITPGSRPIKMAIKYYAIHGGNIVYQNEQKDLSLEMVNLEHEGHGNFASDLFTLKTKSTADVINYAQGGAIPYHLTAKAVINVSFHIDNNNHTYSFNTDQVSFNDLKLHTEGSFQQIDDSSYTMNIKFKSPAMEFKNMLSMLPAVYQKDFASIKSSGQVIFNGFLNGKYDKNHFPAYHVNLDIANGFFQYPDLPMPVENINLRLHVDNPDGAADHLTVNINKGHIEINKESLDFHLLVKNPKTRPFIDLALVGKLDLANVSKLMKLDSGSQLKGLLNTDIYARGYVPGVEKQKKDQWQSGGKFDLRNFAYASAAWQGGIALDNLLMDFNPKNVQISELTGEYFSTKVNATGSINNLFAYALKNQALKATLTLNADEVNLSEWMKNGHASSNNNHTRSAVAVPYNIDFTINVQAAKLHYDNLDMQNVSGNLMISDETVLLDHIHGEALDGNMDINGTYSTKESWESPDIAMIYDVQGLDVQKTFFAFNSLQKIMPVAKFISGKFNAQMSVIGRLGEDMVPDLHSLHGEGTVHLEEGALKEFGPLEKLEQTLDMTTLKDFPLKDINAGFTYQAGKMTLSPFLVHGNDLDMEISGAHGFDQTLEYDITLKVPRSQLGSKGTAFVKNVIIQAADKGIPIKLKDAVFMNVKMNGTINNPEVKADMDGVVDNAATDLKNEVDEFVNAKLDSAKQQLHHPVAAEKKTPVVQAKYKPKSQLKTKKHTASTHKKTSKTKPKSKKKKTTKYYSTSLKQSKSTASNSKK